MRLWTTMLVALALMTLPSLAGAQGTGYYEWSVSSSQVDPYVNTGPDGAGGVATYYLWFVKGCFTPPGDPFMEGMSAADFGLYALGDWSVIAFTAQNGFLNAGTATSLLLAVGGCPTGPIVAGNVLVTGTVGGIRLGVGSTPATTSTVDCTLNPAAWTWPQYVRFTGFKTDGSSATLQSDGNGCTADAVDESSWGTIKSLYRD